MCSKNKKRIVLAITGASGIPYAIRLAQMLIKTECEIFCAISNASKIVAKQEMDEELELSLKKIGIKNIYSESDFFAPMASGSFYFDAMVIAPCSMKTLGKIANSIADNLIVRAAEVALKERRRLVVIPREAPLATTQLKNMLTLSEAGATILPASPAFYQKPKTIEDIVDFVAARAFSSLGFEQNYLKEWGYEN